MRTAFRCARSKPLFKQQASAVRVCCRQPYAAMSSAARYYLQNRSQLVIQKGDITQWEGCAVVNAANERMLGGGGVDGAIHRAAGSALLEACKRYPALVNERCPTGDARITLAYELPCKWVIHTVGPIYSKSSSRSSQAELISAYRASLAVANGVGAETVAFPAISCGIYGYPLQAACQVAIKTCWESAGDLKEIHFVLFGNDTYGVWQAEAQKHLKPVVDDGSDAHAIPPQSASAESNATTNAATNKEGASITGSNASPEAGEQSLAQGDPTAASSPVQTLTGVKHGQAAAAAQEAEAAPRVLEAAEPTAQKASVQTLTGTKQGQAADAAQEALEAPQILETSEPVKQTDLPGHSAGTQSMAIDESPADTDVGMVEADSDGKAASR